MNNQPGNVATHWFAWLAALAAGLGITTQDIAYMVFGLISVVISVASFISGRFDARRKRKEDEKRTKLLQEYLGGVQIQTISDIPTAVKALREAFKQAGG